MMDARPRAGLRREEERGEQEKMGVGVAMIDVGSLKLGGCSRLSKPRTFWKRDSGSPPELAEAESQQTGKRPKTGLGRVADPCLFRHLGCLSSTSRGKNGSSRTRDDMATWRLFADREQASPREVGPSRPCLSLSILRTTSSASKYCLFLGFVTASRFQNSGWQCGAADGDLPARASALFLEIRIGTLREAAQTASRSVKPAAPATRRCCFLEPSKVKRFLASTLFLHFVKKVKRFLRKYARGSKTRVVRILRVRVHK